MLLVVYKKNIENIYFTMIITALLAISISFIPNYENLKNIGVILICLLPFVDINNFIHRNTIFFKMYLYALFILMYFLAITFVNKEGIVIDFRFFLAFIITFSCISSISLEGDKAEVLFLILSIIVLITSYVIILSYYNNIYEAIKNIGIYFYPRKNAFAPLLSVASIYFIHSVLLNNKKLMHLMCAVAAILALMIIQARTNVLGVLVCTVYFGSLRFKNSNKKIVFIIALFILLYVFRDSISAFFYKAFRLDYLIATNQFNISGILSGRNSSWDYGFQYLKNHLFSGMNFQKNYISGLDPSSVTGIHNVWFRNLIYGGIGYFVLFIGYIYQIIKNLSKLDKKNGLLNALILYGFIMSLGEPFAPFAPNMSYVLLWIFILIESRRNKSGGNKSIYYSSNI